MVSVGKGRHVDSALGQRIRDVRSERNLSLRELARNLGVSAAAVSALETGKSSISVDRLHDIAAILDVPATSLLASRSEADTEAVAEDLSFDWRSYEMSDLDAVLEAALAAMTEKGFHGCSIRDIADQAGMSAPALYHYYPSKQAILAALLDATMTDILARARAARDEGRDAVERFTLLIECLVLYHTHRRDQAFVGTSEMRSLDAPDRRRFADQRTALQRLVDTEVGAAVSDGLFQTDHPHEASRGVVTMCTSVAQWFDPRGSKRPDEIARVYVDLALDLVRHRR